jgi:hypothetical protein
MLVRDAAHAGIPVIDAPRAASAAPLPCRTRPGKRRVVAPSSPDRLRGAMRTPIRAA